MKRQFLEAGQIVGTHGVQGEVKILPWADSAEFLLPIQTFYLDGAPLQVLASKVHKKTLLAKLEGVSNVNDAMKLKGKILFLNRDDVVLPQGRHFVADLVGLTAIEHGSGRSLGAVTEVLHLPAHEVYVIEGEKRYLIPAVEEFIVHTDMEKGLLTVKLIEGMGE